MGDLLYIFGCGGHARSIINAVKTAQRECDIVLVDPNCKEGERILGCETMREDIFWEQQNGKFEYLVGIGDNQKRKQMYKRAMEAGGVPQKILSISAVFGLECMVGAGTYVAEKVYIGPLAEVGRNAIINTGSVIEHETKIGDHTHCAPGTVVCGRCNIGNSVFLGAGSTVIDGITITNDVVIGAGSVVIRNIHEKGTYVGCPAKRIHI